MSRSSRHSMDGEIRADDVVVSHVNGTVDFYIVATVLAAPLWDLALDSVSMVKGRDAAILRGYEQRHDDQNVWLFDGSATAYVKTSMGDDLMSRAGQGT